MTTLLHLSAHHSGTYELSDSMNRTTLYSFLSTLCLISAIMLCFSFCYTTLVFPDISPPVIIIDVGKPKIPDSKTTPKAEAPLTKNTKGLIGTTNQTTQDTVTEATTDTHTSGFSEINGDGKVAASIFGDGNKTQSSLVSSPIPPNFDEDENEFEFIPEIEPNVDIASIQKNVVYPSMAIRLEKEGDVVLKVLINEKGKAENIEIVSSTSALFDQAAIDALKHYKTNPAMNNGKAVAYTVYIPIKFRLR